MSSHRTFHNTLNSFFRTHLSHHIQKYIVGLSGGPDSTLLLYSLVKILKIAPSQILALHVDHGWREESSQEAGLVVNWAQSLGVECDVIRLNPLLAEGNLEEWSRNQRRKHFIEYAQRYTGVVLLGHHQDDHLEVVLKRLFEGAPLIRLEGIKPTSVMEEVLFARPLLSLLKGDIITLGQELNIWHLKDPTNQDQKYLRSRMRSTLFPLLNEAFGKEVKAPLSRVSQEVELMQDYFQHEIESAFTVYRGEEIQVSSKLQLHPYMWLQLLNTLPEAKKLRLSRSQLLDICVSAANRKGPVTVSTKYGTVIAKKLVINIVMRHS